MKTILIAAAAAIVIIIATVVTLVIKRKRSRKLKTEHFENRWKAVQRLCGDKSTWPLAVIDGDKLLDDALKKLKYKGKTMGERLVAAQHEMTDNDSVWYAHKLRNKLVHEDATSIKEVAVKDALKGIRQALRDLGALK